MTRKSRAIPILAVLLVAVMALSLFAAPAVAQPTDGTADTQITKVTADDFEDSGNLQDVNREEQIEVTFNSAGTVSSGGQVIANINDDNFDDGEIIIENVAIDPDPDTANSQITDSSDIEIESYNGDVYSSAQDDSIAITLGDGVDSTDITGDYVEVTIEYTVDRSLRGEAANVVEDSVFTVTQDDTQGTTADSLDGEDLVTLDIQPGAPDEYLLNAGSSQVKYGVGSTTVDVTTEDQFDNELLSVSLGADTVLSDIYSNQDFSVTLQNSSGGSVDSVAEGDSSDVRINYNSDEEDTTFTIDATADNSDEINNLVVSDQLAIEADSEGPTAGAFDFVVEPDGVQIDAERDEFQNAAEAGTGIDAADGESEVSVTFLDDGDSRIGDDEIDEIQIDFTNLASNGANAVLTGLDREINDTHSSVVVDQNLDESGAGNLTFEETNSDYDGTLTVDVEPRDGVTGEGDNVNINVFSGAPAELTFSDDSFDEQDIVDNAGEVVNTDVQVRDAEGNIIDDRNFGSTTVEVEVDGDGQQDTTEFSIGTGGTPSGAQTVSFQRASTSAAGDLEVAVAAGTVDIALDQVKQGGLGTELTVDDSVQLTLLPDVEITDQPANLDANETSSASADNLTIQLSYSDDQSVLESADLGQVTVEYDLVYQNLQEGVDAEDVDGMLDPDDEQDVTLSYDQSVTTQEVGHEFKTAGEYAVAVNAVPAAEDSSDITEVQSDDFVISALGVNASESSVTPTNDFAGVVEDGETTDVEIELRDKFGNIAGYDGNANIDASNFDVTVAGQNIETDEPLTSVFDEGMATSVGDAPATLTYTLDSSGDLNADSETGEADITVNDPDSESTTGSIELVHEAYGLEEGFQRVSVPQPTEAYAENIDHFTTWNATAENYDSDAITVTGSVVGTSELHSGIYANASTDARIGYDFETDESVTVGQESLEAGWNFVGTNFDVSNGANNPMALNEDLLTVDDISDDPSASEVVQDGGLKNLLDASNGGDNTDQLSDAIDAGGAGNGEYRTYWVYVEDPSSLTSADRQIVGPQYNPSSRDGVMPGQ